MKALEQPGPKLHFAPLPTAQLEKLGVRVQNRFDLLLECRKCGEQWSPQYNADGTLPRGYWMCPNRCNW